MTSNLEKKQINQNICIYNSQTLDIRIPKVRWHGAKLSSQSMYWLKNRTFYSPSIAIVTSSFLEKNHVNTAGE